MYFDIEDELLLASVRIKPTEADRLRISELLSEITDWNYVCMNAIDRGMAPLLLRNIQSFEIPDKVRNALQDAYYRTLSRSMVLYQAFGEVIDALHSRGIQVIVLKGAYLSECLYGDIGLRQFSDLDLLIREEDGEKGVTVLAENGYRLVDLDVSKFIGSQTEIIHYAPMVKNGVSVELHIRLHRKSKQYDIQTRKFIQRAIPVTVNGRQVWALNDYDLLIHSFVHLDKHFEGGHVQFTSFNDIANILIKVLPHFDWELFGERCEESKCTQVAYKYMLLVSNFYQIDLPVAITTEYQYLLTDEIKDKFVAYLHGETYRKYHTETHWQNIREIKLFSLKVRYFVELIFPPKKFIIKKYHLSSREGLKAKLWWLWYPYRWGVGVKGLWKVISHKSQVISLLSLLCCSAP